MIMEATNNTDYLHLGIAEKGKLYALEGNYKEALRHYKEAIKMTQNKPQGELFFQHYAQCTMEALELTGSHDEVIHFCEKFLDLLEEKENNELIIKYKADILQRMAIQYLLKNDTEEAEALFKTIRETIGVGKQKLTDELMNWIQRRYTLSKKQICDMQKKYQYFIVTKENVRPEIAVELPEIIKHY